MASSHLAVDLDAEEAPERMKRIIIFVVMETVKLGHAVAQESGHCEGHNFDSHKKMAFL